MTHCKLLPAAGNENAHIDARATKKEEAEINKLPPIRVPRVLLICSLQNTNTHTHTSKKSDTPDKPDNQSLHAWLDSTVRAPPNFLVRVKNARVHKVRGSNNNSEKSNFSKVTLNYTFSIIGCRPKLLSNIIANTPWVWHNSSFFFFPKKAAEAVAASVRCPHRLPRKQETVVVVVEQRERERISIYWYKKEKNKPSAVRSPENFHLFFVSGFLKTI